MSQKADVLSVSSKIGVVTGKSPLAAAVEATIEDILLLNIA